MRRTPLRELIAYLNSIDILVSDLTIQLVEDLSNAPADIQACMQEYQESYMGEMFDTEEAVIKYMKKHQKDYELGKDY